LACLLAWGATGCAEGARTLPFPEFDATGPFPELEADAPVSAGRPDPESDFERALVGDAPDAPVRADTASRRLAPLPGRLVAEMPARFDEWTYAADRGTTLIFHTPPGAAPDVLVYAEGFGPGILRAPSSELRGFRVSADPTFDPLRLATRAIPLALGAAGIREPGLADAIAALVSRTGGRGLGYRSAEDTFSGWRWVGRNPAGLELRMGRTSGVWGPPPPLGPDAASALERLASRFRDLEAPIRTLLEATRGQAEVQLPTRRAWMVLGSVVVRHDLGAHLAVVCAADPTCPHAAELARLLETIRPGTPEELAELDAQRRGAPTPEDAAKRLGISLGGGAVELDDVVTRLVDEARKAAEAAKAAEGLPANPLEGIELPVDLPVDLPIPSPAPGAGP
jgi:hypothetical protein